MTLSRAIIRHFVTQIDPAPSLELTARSNPARPATRLPGVSGCAGSVMALAIGIGREVNLQFGESGIVPPPPFPLPDPLFPTQALAPWVSPNLDPSPYLTADPGPPQPVPQLGQARQGQIGEYPSNTPFWGRRMPILHVGHPINLPISANLALTIQREYIQPHIKEKNSTYIFWKRDIFWPKLR